MKNAAFHFSIQASTFNIRNGFFQRFRRGLGVAAVGPQACDGRREVDAEEQDNSRHVHPDQEHDHRGN